MTLLAAESIDRSAGLARLDSERNEALLETVEATPRSGEIIGCAHQTPSQRRNTGGANEKHHGWGDQGEVHGGSVPS